MKIKYPDYDHSILSVTASVLKHYGVTDCEHKTLPELDKALEKKYKNVIVMLFDGMGSSSLEYHLPEDAFLRQHKVCNISSIFPPTTVAATTTVESGLSPLEHSWLGWNLYFNELDETVTVFRNALARNGMKIKEYNVGKKYIPYKSVFERIKETNPHVITHFLSIHSNEKVFSVSQAMRKIKRLSKQPSEKYIYFYWPQPDHTMHSVGVEDKKVGALIKGINKNVERLSKELTDSIVVVIADHGLIDVKWQYLEDYPEISNMLIRAPSIEPRALSLYVKEGFAEQFKTAFNKAFGDKFMLMSKDEVYESNLFGMGVVGKKTDDFLGDYLAVATGDTCLTMSPWKHTLKSSHAGLTEDEMTVPFIIYK